jgi:Na+-transporting methylmalonyl-CoA/oxaloacetate decarboxylase gamma subunit
MDAFSFQNVVNSNGIAISLTGMAIVFSGLLLISLSLWSLPRVLALFEKGDMPSTAETPQNKSSIAPSTNTTAIDTNSEENDIAGIIGLVLQLEDQRRLTNASPALQAVPN